MMNDEFVGGLLIGIGISFIFALLIVFLTSWDNPTHEGYWDCTDWRIVNYKPECRVMTKFGSE
jgi:hypothetical protein